MGPSVHTRIFGWYDAEPVDTGETSISSLRTRQAGARASLGQGAAGGVSLRAGDPGIGHGLVASTKMGESHDRK
jgi:hypothetical protein